MGIAQSSFYYRPKAPASRTPRRQRPTTLPNAVLKRVVKMAEGHPWWGYKRIAVLCRRAHVRVSNRQVYRVMKAYDLLAKKKPKRDAELHQTRKLYELLPGAPNDLWQTDVTYIHVPGYGWWYAVTVIDYYSRYLLAIRFTHSYSAAEAIEALKDARQEAERIHGPLKKDPFLITDNGTTFIAKRFVKYVADDFTHLRIQYRTPTQLGLLERFHGTLKREEVYWCIYDSPEHARQCLAEFRTRYNDLRPHWALVPACGGDPVTPAEVYTHGVVTKIPKWQTWAIKAKKNIDSMMDQQEAVG